MIQHMRTSNALNQYVSRTVPGNVQVHGEADAAAVVTVNENPTWRSGEYFYGEAYLPTYDANGNISEYIDSSDGSVAAHYDYSPFGETLVASGPLAASFTHRFSTKPWCPVTGFCEYQMRKYNPNLGRWMSRDPIGEEGGGNLYLAVLNSLIDLIDAKGDFVDDSGIRDMGFVGSIEQNPLAKDGYETGGYFIGEMSWEAECVTDENCGSSTSCGNVILRITEDTKIVGATAVLTRARSMRTRQGRTVAMHEKLHRTNLYRAATSFDKELHALAGSGCGTRTCCG